MSLKKRRIPLTDSQPLAVAIVDGTGDQITSFPGTTGGLTDAQLRATPVPVSGTVTANAGSGTLAVSAASLPLPSGASTVAKQPALGTAGTASADVISVQGIASMTALKVDGSGVTQPVSGTVTTTPPANASTNLAQIVGTAADVNSGVKSAGTLRVVLATDQPALTNKLLVTPDLPTGASTAAKQPALGTAGAASADVITVQGAASMTKLLVTPDSVALPANQSVNVAQVAGTTADTNSGTKSAGTIRVVLATDQPALTNKLLVTPDSVALPANQSTNISQINAVTPLMGAGNTGTGSLRVTISTDQAQLTNKLLVTPDANSAVNVAQVNGVTVLMGNGASGTGAQRVTLANDSTGTVGLLPKTAGGLTTFHLVSAATTNATNLKASAGQVYGWYIYNSNAAARKVAFHNTAGTPTAGASIYYSLVIPPASGANVFSETGIAFSTGIAITTVTELTDAGNTAVALNDLIINIWYN